MEHALAQLKADSADAVTFAGHSLTHVAMTLCGLAIVLGIVAGGAWHWLARPRHNVKRILRDPEHRAAEANVLARARRAGL